MLANAFVGQARCLSICARRACGVYQYAHGMWLSELVCVCTFGVRCILRHLAESVLFVPSYLASCTPGESTAWKWCIFVFARNEKINSYPVPFFKMRSGMNKLAAAIYFTTCTLRAFCGRNGKKRCNWRLLPLRLRMLNLNSIHSMDYTANCFRISS